MRELEQAIRHLAEDAWRDYRTARTEQERQQAIDQGADIERLAAEKLGFDFADSLPWNTARQARQAAQ